MVLALPMPSLVGTLLRSDLANEWGELAATLFCPISVGYYLELRGAKTLTYIILFYQLSHIIFFVLHFAYQMLMLFGQKMLLPLKRYTNM